MVITESIDPTASNALTSDQIITINAIDSVVSTGQSETANHLISDHIVTSEDNVLNSITADKLTIDTISLLQQFHPTDNDGESIPLILDDVTFLNIESSGENMQIISLADLDPSIIQTQVI